MSASKYIKYSSGNAMNKLTIDFLAPYTSSMIGTLQMLAMEMQTFGLDATDVIALTKEYFNEIAEQVATDKPSLPHGKPNKLRPVVLCPVCRSMVSITPVNVSKCTNVGGPWKTSLMCSNADCRFTELSEKTLAEWEKVPL